MSVIVASRRGSSTRLRAVSESGPQLTLHPDRLLPADPSTRAVARRLHAAVADAALVSPHGHVDPALLVHDEPFGDPVSLLVTPDHYVTRLLHASGIPLDALGVGRGPLDETAARAAWRAFCSRWDVFVGTPVRTWLEAELVEIFGVTQRPTAASADAIYDRIAVRLAEPDLRPRALYDRFRLQVLATTDDPCSDLAAHRALAADPTWRGRVIPTFRPDRYLEVGEAGWPDAVARLAAAADVDGSTHAGFLAAIEARRRYFIEHGATSADHAHADARAEPLDAGEADRLHGLALRREATAAETVALRRHLLFEMARMSCDDGLVMTLHPGVARGHHASTVARFGPDTGSDVPHAMEYVRALQPLLSRFGTSAGFHLVLFTVDETMFSRELAPLAGFYPSVYIGVPWWFLDAPDAMRRFRRATMETAGFTRTSGFVDDTRAYCSIPARHDMARRIDAGVLGELVVEHRLDEDEALAMAHQLVVQATTVFKL
jgi:glucuronate isomerase